MVCKLDLLGSSPNVSMWCARTVRVLGTRVTRPVSWCISKSARTSSQLVCTHGGLASSTYSDTPRVFWVYQWILIAYPFRVASTPSIILVLRELFFLLQSFPHSALEIARPSQITWSVPPLPLNIIHDPGVSPDAISLRATQRCVNCSPTPGLVSLVHEHL